jgi:hypothetical protein
MQTLALTFISADSVIYPTTSWSSSNLISIDLATIESHEQSQLDGLNNRLLTQRKCMSLNKRELFLKTFRRRSVPFFGLKLHHCLKIEMHNYASIMALFCA